LQNLGALDKEDPFTGVFFLIDNLFSNRCEFDSRPELHLDFSEKYLCP
jgi:hypothetical protein